MIQQVDTPSYIASDSPLIKEQPFTLQFKRWSWVLLIGAILYQCFFHWSVSNGVAMCTIVLAWLITTKIILGGELIKKFPLSTFLLLGFTSSQFYLPLIFTTGEAKSLLYNLEVPELVFLHSTLVLFVLLFAHLLHQLLSKLSDSRSFSLLTKLGFFTPPRAIQLWLMGLMGTAAAFYIYFVAKIGSEVTGSASDKFVQGLLPFQYAPYFIPLGSLYGSKEKNSKSLGPALLIFTVLLFGLSVGRNSTGAFMLGFTAIGFGYLLGLLLGIFETPKISIKNILAGVFGLWLMVGPLADLRTAMVNVRDQRTEVAASELIGLTWEAFNDKKAIEARRKTDGTQEDPDWDERYLDNVFTARFGNIKFNDLNLVQADKVGEYDPDMLEFVIDHLLGAMPDPFLRALKLEVDKEAVYSISIGDFLYITAGGSGTISGFRTGHFAGIGMATFGWWYLFILGVAMVFVFALFDKFYKTKPPTSVSSDNLSNQKMYFSLCGLLSTADIFGWFIGLQCVTEIIVFIVREWIQLAVLYLIIFHVTRIISGLIKKPSKSL